MQSKSRLSQQKSVPSLRTVEEEGKENTDPGRMNSEEQSDLKFVFPSEVKEEDMVPASRRESTSSMIFSPLRDIDSPLSLVNGGQGQGKFRENLSTSSVLFSPVRDTDTSHETTDLVRTEARLFSDSVFSPLHDSVSPAAGLGPGRRTPLSGLSTPAVSPLVLPAIREVREETKERLEAISEKSPAFQDLVQDQAVSPTASQHSSSVSSQTEDVPRSREVLNVLTAFPAVAGSKRTDRRPDLSSAVEKITDRLSNTDMTRGPGLDPEVFQKEFISGVVSEAMQEWCDGVEQRLWGLQYSLVRQMQHHQEETLSMLGEMTGLTRLRQENERLQQENRELRKFFGSNP